MTSAVSIPLPVDPTKAGKYPITISKQLLQEDGPRKRQRIAMRLVVNHRPKSFQASKRALITPSQGGEKNQYKLVVGDKEHKDEYKYSGCQSAFGDLALFYNPEKHSFTLDRIDNEFRFNLCSTPNNHDAADLARRYPHIDTAHSPPQANGDDLFDEDGNGEEHKPEDAEPDPSNPYDYRHYLRNRPTVSPAPSATSSPMLQANGKTNTSTINSRTTAKPNSLLPAQRPPKPRQSNPKPRPRDRPQYLSPSPAQREETDADNEESDTNELIIDMGDSAKSKTTWHRSALGVLNEGGRSAGPISLRSAASSMSPSIRGESDGEGRKNGRDDDIEEIDLGAPKTEIEEEVAPPAAAAAKVEVKAVEDGNGWDDEDDVAAELENAMMQEEQAEGQAKPVTANNESSSESEEE